MFERFIDEDREPFPDLDDPERHEYVTLMDYLNAYYNKD